MVDIREHTDCRFGHGYRAICMTNPCSFVGPVVNLARAEEIADEHRLKSIGQWRPAK